MKRGFMALLGCVLFLLSCRNVPTGAKGPALGSVHYVDAAAGDDSADGSFSAPWRTIQKACDSVVKGDTVMVRPGSYREAVTLGSSRNPGLAADPPRNEGERISFVSSVPREAVIDTRGSGAYSPWIVYALDYIAIRGFRFVCGNTHSGPRFASIEPGRGCRYAVFEGNLVEDVLGDGSGGTGVVFDYGDGGVARGNEVARTAWNGIDFEGGNDVLMECNYVHDCREHAGLQLYPRHSEGDSNFYHGSVIRYNVLAGNGSGIYLRNAVDFRIYGNLLRDNYGHSRYGIELGEGDGSSGSFDSRGKIFDNTIIGHKYSIYDKAFNGLEIMNNIFGSRDDYALYADDDASRGHLLSRNIFLDGKPLRGFDIGPDSWRVPDLAFADAAKGDYRLAAGAFAIDRGAERPYMSEDDRDLDGRPRPVGKGRDAGAYEFPE